jgi:hypothetical protein
MTPVRFIPCNGKQILLMDFTNANTNAEITQTVEEIKKAVAMQQPHSLMALLDVTGTSINRKRIRRIQDMAAHNRPYVKFIALVGLGLFRSMAFRIMLRVTGRKNHMVFRKREKALEWLVER